VSESGGGANPRQVALDIASHLDALHIPYAITGALASGIYGEPRATYDVDLIADLDADHAAMLSERLASAYYIDGDAVRDAVRLVSSFNVIHLAAMIKVDVYAVGDDPFQQERLRRRIRIDVPDGPIDHLWIDAAECTVLRKLEWYRRGGEVSDRQWRDVLAIFRIQGDALDDAFMDHWAPRLGVVDLLDKARREALG
jgi:hypothetical protein